MLAQAVTTAKAAGAAGQLLCRADSAYYGWAFVGTALRHGAWFSVTARANASITRVITIIQESVWSPIRYPHAVWDEDEQRWISDAEVAEVPYVAFTSRRKPEHVECRLVVRRVKRLQPATPDGSQQGELLPAWRYHAFVTNSTLSTIEADQRHREHAIIEQVIAELKDGPLAHLPSGSYPANAAWAALAVTAFNIARAAAVAAAMSTARWATLRRRIINVPPGSPPAHGTSCCTYPTSGPGSTPGPPSRPRPPAPQYLSRPDRSPPRGSTPSKGHTWKSRYRPADPPRSTPADPQDSPPKQTTESRRWIKAQAA